MTMCDDICLLCDKNKCDKPYSPCLGRHRCNDCEDNATSVYKTIHPLNYPDEWYSGDWSKGFRTIKNKESSNAS